MLIRLRSTHKVEADVDVHSGYLKPVCEGREGAQKVFGVSQPPRDVSGKQLKKEGRQRWGVGRKKGARKIDGRNEGRKGKGKRVRE